MDSIGRTIREIRKKKNLTLRDVALMTSLTESLISQIETSKANPSIASLVAISRALGVPIGAFFESITQKLARISDDTVLYPGHLYSPEPSATMGETRRQNFVFMPRTADQWVAMFGG